MDPIVSGKDKVGDLFGQMLSAVARAAELKPGTAISVAQTKESAGPMNADDASRVFSGEVRVWFLVSISINL